MGGGSSKSPQQHGDEPQQEVATHHGAGWSQVRTGVTELGVLHGLRLRHKFPTGGSYVGGFREGKLHGYGTLSYPQNDTYEGQWDDGLKHGQGTYTYDNGDVYSGQWHYGRKCGQGKFSYKSGDSYVGHWKDDELHGLGEFVVVCHGARGSSKYTGEWSAGTRHGSGTEVRDDGDVITGNWVDGKLQGVVTVLNGNTGDIFLGRFKDDRKDGPAILREASRLDRQFAMEFVSGYATSKVPVLTATYSEPKFQELLLVFHQLYGKEAQQDYTASPDKALYAAADTAADMKKVPYASTWWERMHDMRASRFQFDQELDQRHQMGVYGNEELMRRDEIVREWQNALRSASHDLKCTLTALRGRMACVVEFALFESGTRISVENMFRSSIAELRLQMEADADIAAMNAIHRRLAARQ